MGLQPQSGARRGGSCIGAALLALLATGGAASAAPRPITGSLTQPGYTVIALGTGDHATSVLVRRGRFRLSPPAGRVALHLRGPDGGYAGPIVVGRERTRAILGVKAGARLGRVSIRSGYARAVRSVPRRWIDASRWARTRRGVPLGARNFGRVRSRPVPGADRGDRDVDGVPDVLDVDDDGDRILDRFEDASGRGSARAAQPGVDPESEDPENLPFDTRFELTLAQTVNANATSPGDPLTVARIDAALSTFGRIHFIPLPGDSHPDSPELDCGGDIQDPPRPIGLVYCRPHSSGGTGTVVESFCCPAVIKPFPDDFDPDQDGAGTITPTPGPGDPDGGPRPMVLHHGATTAEIGTGDIFAERVRRNGTVISFPAMLDFVFATVPALASYDDGSRTRLIEYPVQVPPDPDGPGPMVPPEPTLPVTAPPNQDVVVTLAFWRPQRRAVSDWGETGDWIDIGGLGYSVHAGPRSCPRSAFSLSEPLEANDPVENAPGFQDRAPSRSASRLNTFTYSLNLSQCAAASGIPFGNPGDSVALSFSATRGGPIGTGGARATQRVVFKRE